MTEATASNTRTAVCLHAEASG